MMTAPEGKRILVVDDDGDTRRFLSVLLEDHGYETSAVADGDEALASIERERPDLVTLDVAMPSKSGIWVYRMLRDCDGLRQIPVVIVTGAIADFEQYLSSRRQVPPPDGFISKPIKPGQLLEAVAQALCIRATDYDRHGDKAPRPVP